MSIFDNNIMFDDFAAEAFETKRRLEFDIWCRGIPGLIALIRTLVKNGYSDQPKLVDAIRGLSEVFDHVFLDAFIDYLTGPEPGIHILDMDDDEQLVLIENVDS